MTAFFLILGGAVVVGLVLVYASRRADTEPFLSAEADKHRALKSAFTKESRP